MSTTVTHARQNTSSAIPKSESAFWRKMRYILGSRPVEQDLDEAAEPSTFPKPDGDTEILPAVPAAVEVVEHYTSAQLDPVPVLAAIGEDAARATGGKISPQAASQLLHKHLAALDWRLSQARRAASNIREAQADAANLAAADEAASKLGARVVVDSRAMVDTILRRADMASNPAMNTQTFQNVSAATQFPAPMAGGHPTIGDQRPARELGAGDFLLDVDDTGAPDPLSMWRLVEKVELIDERVVAVLVDGRALGFAPDELVWLLPPLAGRKHRDAAGNGHVPQRPTPAVVRPAIPSEREVEETAPGDRSLPQRVPHVTVIPAPLKPDGSPRHGERVNPREEPITGRWVFYGGANGSGPVYRQVESVAVGEESVRIVFRSGDTQTIKREAKVQTVRALNDSEAAHLLAEYQAAGAGNGQVAS